MTAIDCKSQRRGARARGWVNGSCAAVVVIAASLTAAYGAHAAEAAEAKPSPTAAEAAGRAAPGPEVSLAGRWSGRRAGYASRRGGEDACRDGKCQLTYDIVACAEGWCGIAVEDNGTRCAGIALRMAREPRLPDTRAFSGKLELAKGSAAYVINAWLRPAPEGAPHLSIVGDTGGDLILMRRSFPFQATLTRISDATCTMEKATS